MLKLHTRSLVFLFLLAFPMAVFAATHDVAVMDNFFSPNDLTINVGDTVRWTSISGGAPHDVTEDNFKWSSETSTAFNFSKTFNTAEEILYHCTVHSFSGRDRDTRMNGRITVEGVSIPPFLINDALSDAWYFPETDGQGFLIIVWETRKLVFLSWYTYDTERPPEDVTAILGEPGHRWLTALGPYEGDTALMDVFLSQGMIFDSAELPVDTVQYPGATMEIVWTGCNAGIVKYNIPSLNLVGEVPIERIADDHVAACEAAQP
jgi:plastocyanin